MSRLRQIHRLHPRAVSVVEQRYRWWFLAVDVCARLTTPPVNIAASDQRVERLLRESWLWSLYENLAEKTRAAWMESRLRAWAGAATSEWLSSDARLSWRAVGLVMKVWAITAVALQLLRPTGFDPFSWAVPVAVGIAGVILPRVANRGARTIASERS